MKQFGLDKHQKLCGSLRVQTLMHEGKALTSYPLRWKWSWHEPVGEKAAIRVLFWAPKRQFKHAVDRNRLRRLMREAYRMQQGELQRVVEQQGRDLQLAITYIGEDMCELAKIQKAIDKGIRKFINNSLQPAQEGI